MNAPIPYSFDLFAALVVLHQSGYTPDDNGKIPGLFVDIDGDEVLADVAFCVNFVANNGSVALRALIAESNLLHHR